MESTKQEEDEMTFTQEDKQAMDDAAIDAENDLSELTGVDENLPITSVADWLSKWVMKAGYKRLGRILIQYKTE